MSGRARHPLNCEGSFYVADGECMSCGAPEMEAEGLMAHAEGGHCYFASQPGTEEQTNSALRAMGASCCGAVRYGGIDRDILVRIERLGMSDQSDHPPPQVRSRPLLVCSFELDLPSDSAREALDIVATLLSMPSKWKRRSEIRVSDAGASFQLSWGHDLLPQPASIDFTLVAHAEKRWKMRLSGKNATVWSAASTDRALRNETSIRNIRWFEESDWPVLAGRGTSYPY